MQYLAFVNRRRSAINQTTHRRRIFHSSLFFCPNSENCGPFIRSMALRKKPSITYSMHIMKTARVSGVLTLAVYSMYYVRRSVLVIHIWSLFDICDYLLTVVASFGHTLAVFRVLSSFDNLLTHYNLFFLHFCGRSCGSCNILAVSYFRYLTLYSKTNQLTNSLLNQ